MRILLALLLCSATADAAGPLRLRRAPTPQYRSQPTHFAPSAPGATGPSGDGLDELNAIRARRGLKPFIRDEGLTKAAFAVAADLRPHLERLPVPPARCSFERRRLCGLRTSVRVAVLPHG